MSYLQTVCSNQPIMLHATLTCQKRERNLIFHDFETDFSSVELVVNFAIAHILTKQSSVLKAMMH